MACIDPGDVGPWGATKRHRGVPIPSPGSPGLPQAGGDSGGALGDLGRACEEPAHGNCWPKAVSQTAHTSFEHERLNFPTGSANSLPCHNFVNATKRPLWALEGESKQMFECGEGTSPWAALDLVALCSWHVLLLLLCMAHTLPPLCPTAQQVPRDRTLLHEVWVLIIASGNHGRSHSLWSDSAPCHPPSHRVAFFPELLTVLL